MPQPWTQVEQNPQYQSLPPDQQQAAKDQYFGSVVAPKVPPDQVDVARHQFYLDTSPKPTQQDNQDPWANTGNNMLMAGMRPLAGTAANVANTAKGMEDNPGDTLKSGLTQAAQSVPDMLSNIGQMVYGKKKIVTDDPFESAGNIAQVAGPFAGVLGGAKGEAAEVAPTTENQMNSMFSEEPKGPTAKEEAEAEAAVAGQGLTPAKERAYAILNTIAKNEGADLQGASDAAKLKQQSGLPLTNLDALTMDENGFPTAGRGFQAATRAAIQQPGEASQLASELAKRHYGLNGYMDNLLDKHFAEGDLYKTIDEANSGMDAASPKYEQAMSKAPVWSDDIQAGLNDPDVRSGIPAGMRLQRLEAYAQRKPYQPFDLAETGVTPAETSKNPFTNIETTNKEAGTQFSDVPNMRLIDAAKRGLDAKIQAAQAGRQFAGRATSEERALVQTKQRFLADVDKVNPDYAAARQSFADPASQAHAAEMGRNYKTMDPEEIEQFFKDPETSAAQKAAFKEGARYDMKSDVAAARDGTPKVNSFWTQDMRARLKPMMQNDEAFGKLANGLEDLRNMASNNTILRGGPATFENLQYKGAMSSKKNPLSRVIKGITNPQGALLGEANDFVGNLYNNKEAKMSSDVSSELAKMLLSKDPNALAEAALWGKNNGFGGK